MYDIEEDNIPLVTRLALNPQAQKIIFPDPQMQVITNTGIFFF